MKKYFLFFAFASVTTRCISQTTWGIQGGFNFGTLSLGNKGNTVPSLTKVLITIGAFANKPLNHVFSFRPEFNYIEKGGRFKPDNGIFGTIYSKNANEELDYLQLLPDFTASLTDDNVNIFFGVGPEFSFGLGGHDASTIAVNNGTAYIQDSGSKKIVFDGKVNAHDGHTHYKRMNIGLNFTAGLQTTGGFMISAAFTPGESNIYPDSSFRVKTRCVTIKLGWTLNKRKRKH